MNLKLSCYISSMRNHRIDRDKEMVSYLLIGHTLNQSNNDILLTITQLFIVLWSLGYHIRNLRADIILLQLPLCIPYCRNKDFLLDFRVVLEPFLIIIYIIKRSTELIIVQPIRRKIFDDDIF